jgi:signal transduction histidine kinase
MPRAGAINGPSERRWARLDWLVAVVLGAWSALALRSGTGGGPLPAGLPGFRLHHGQYVPLALLVACVILASLPIGLRRRWPLPVLVVVTGATAVLAICGSSPLGVGILLALAGYSVVTQRSRHLALRAIVGAEAALGGAIVVGLLAFDTAAFGVLIPLVVAWFVGDSVAARRAYLAAQAEQVRQAAVIEAERTRQTLREERMAIARELHDVVAHSLTVISVQAGVGRRLAGRQSDQAETTLRTIEETARTAQEELGVVLGLLRDGDGRGADLAPAPGLDDLEALAATMRASGTPVELHIAGADRQLSPALELTAYRIVQEALTNVAKHAPGAQATVRLAITPQSVSIVVEDHGGTASQGASEPPSRPGSEHGIVGMRERVAAFGGSLSAALLPDGGFRVTAVLPLSKAS